MTKLAYPKINEKYGVYTFPTSDLLIFIAPYYNSEVEIIKVWGVEANSHSWQNDNLSGHQILGYIEYEN